MRMHICMYKCMYLYKYVVSCIMNACVYVCMCVYMRECTKHSMLSRNRYCLTCDQVGDLSDYPSFQHILNHPVSSRTLQFRYL